MQQIDFTVMYLDQQEKHAKEQAQRELHNKKLIESGVVSALDLAAPNRAVEQFNKATTLLKAQHSKEAMECLQKAIKTYPNFVSAHNALGLAYLDQDDGRARSEFETAAKLDERFPGSFLNLGMLELSQKDFLAARTDLEKAAALSPQNPKVLASLAFAQIGDHQYEQTLQTAKRVHALAHPGVASVHYTAAAAAMALGDFSTMQNELSLFLAEDPTNPLAPNARKNLEILDRRKLGVPPPSSASQETKTIAVSSLQTFPNSERLRSELRALSDGPTVENHEADQASTEIPPTSEVANASAGMASLASAAAAGYTIHKIVDETALFFAVSSHGNMVNDLDLANIRILDDNKAPEKVLQFVPQSKLPLRLALIIDTSGSVQERFSFEKRAAAKFLQSILNGTSDLGFVAGFSSETKVSQDFVADPIQLAHGVETLVNGGGTALFDAVSFACWKLAAYPEHERVARVLVVLSDGEDNSSHRSLKQSIEQAESSGVTIYTVSTRENGERTDADKVMEVLAERSGGEAMFPSDMPTLEKSLAKLRDLIRSRYLLAYRPADFQPNGQYRNIRINAEKDGKRLQVHVRKGYYARLQAK